MPQVDQSYQNYLASVNQAASQCPTTYTDLNSYSAGLAAAKAAYTQTVTDENEYYNSDDEDEPLCTAAPQYTQSYYQQHYQPGAISCESIAQNNKYLSNKYVTNSAQCTPNTTNSYTTNCSTTGYDAHTAETPNYNYSQNICNLKYTAPKAKTTFCLAYKKPVAKVYVYNNYIQNQDNYQKGPYYEKKTYDLPSTCSGMYATK